MRKLTGSTFVALAAVLAAGMLVACGGSSGTAGGSDVPKSDATTDLPKFEGTADTEGDTPKTDVATPDGEEPDAVEPDEGVADPGKDEGKPDDGKPDTAQPETTQPDPGPVVECEDAADCEGKLEGIGPCDVATCEQTTRTCVARVKQNGAACDDENECTRDDYCSNGVCKGKPVTCDDDNVCTNDDCDPDSGCTHANNKVACDDGSACTKDDQCKDGACVPGENSCQCQADKDCIPMDDGDLCNGVMKCVA
ncbi:MAG: hypothetical protein FJ087_19635, partial [Deltaproteobacteria bacterium]|nr:hypothetical protein [Deltaproteobacteria bacterium]